ncbi:MAG: 3-oxoacyl-ACP reductase [Elusimicrobia bacterium]|nr:MAG: 3-oxoacyl-ACP reductase [Elusimicrobiota bacterium]
MPKQSLSKTREPIAVVGISAIYPGSLDKKGFWKDIAAGKDMMREVPSSHWLIEDYYDPDPKAPEKTYCKRGAFLSPVDFDALGFGIPPKLLPATDTTQLLALLAAKRCLDEATMGKFDEADKDRISIILGVVSPLSLAGNMWSKLQKPVWLKALRDAKVPEDEAQDICKRIANEYPEWVESTFPGLLGNVVAGRVANRLDLGGTNCITDAACASSFSALTMAVDQLYLGDADMVVTGGIDAMNDILMYMCFSKTPAISASGDCRPFSDKGDGTMLGEGAGLFALKRLDDAERDGNTVYAVLKGVGSSSDGKSKSVYAPVAAGQAKAVRRAYEKAAIDPSTIELVEAHGTGTLAGDVAELGGLTSVYENGIRKDKQWCALGSVKSQIGHTKAAAGAAGLFKMVMALHHKTLPPIIKVDRPHPKFDMPNTPFYLNTETRPWVRNEDHPRRAAVSAFGFGGANYHIALEEYTGANRPVKVRSFPTELVLLCGPDRPALLKACSSLRAELSELPDLLAFIASESQKRFNASAHERLAVTAKDENDLVQKLQSVEKILADGGSNFAPGIHYASGASSKGKVAFLFSGQGSQYVGMGKDLLMAFDSAREPVDFAAGMRFGDTKGLHGKIYPTPVFTDEDRSKQNAELTQTEWSQPAIGLISLSQLALLDRLGIKPDFLGGHSFGELTALYASGAYDRETFLAIARKRGELMAESSKKSGGKGAMLAVSASVSDVETVLKKLNLNLVAANQNSPKQTVLSGDAAEIDRAQEVLASEHMTAKRLPVSTAFHSSMMNGARDPFLAFLDKAKISAVNTPVYANTTAKPYPKSAKALRSHLADQIISPVLFASQVQAMYEAGVRTFVEVGPGRVLTSLLRDNLGEKPHLAVSLDKKKSHGVSALWDSLGALAVAGIPLDFAALCQEYGTPADPRKIKKFPLTVKVSGVNHGRPYPPEGGAAALPKPQPPRAAQAAPAVVQPNPEAEMSNSNTDPRYSAWLEAFKEMERTTSEAHTAYQKSMADSHMQFLQMAQASLANMTSLISGQPVAPAPIVPIAAPAPVVPVAAPVPIAAPAPVVPVAAPVPIAAPAPVVPVAAPAPVVSAPASVSGGLDNLEAALIEVVADKTGYPTEVLNPEMNYESDLGVDSIKRVEILAALKEKVPNLPDVPAEELAALQTLGQTVAYINERAGINAPAAAPVAAAPSSEGSLSIQDALIKVVADKTGYPVEVLNPEMNYESDLGVDSIKRVEILAALKEEVPNLPEVPAEELAALQTLGATVAYIENRGNGAVATASTPATKKKTH